MDRNSDHKTDRYFRERLAGIEPGPPDATWENISLEMVKRRKKRVMLMIFRIAAGMAILLSTGIGYYLLSRPEGEVQPAVLSENREQSVTADEPAQTTDARTNQNILQDQNAEVVPGIQENLSRNPKSVEITAINPVTPGMVNEESHTTPSETQEDSYDDLARIEPAVRPIRIADSVDILPDFRDIPSDTVFTSKEAAALLLAQYYGADKPEEKNERRWTLGGELAPLYSDRNIRSDMSQSEEDDLNASESGILAYAGGFRVGFSTGKRLSIHSGIYYSRYGQEKSGVEAVVDNPSNPENYNFIAVANSTGTIGGVIDKKAYFSNSLTPDYISSQNDYRAGIVNTEIYPLVQGNVEDVSLRQYFDYFEVPLIVKYKVIDRKIDFNFSGGVVTNFLVGNSVNMINEGKTTRIGETADINEVNYLGSFGLGLEYPIVSNFAITLEPRIRYYLNPIDKSGITVHPFSVGFFAGINYRF